MPTANANYVVTEVEDQGDYFAKPQVERAQCPGVGTPITSRKGAKKRYGSYGSLTYPCPECGRYFKKDPDTGDIPRHVAKTAAQIKREAAAKRRELSEQGLAEGFCAGCSTMKWMEKGDFLCRECRD